MGKRAHRLAIAQYTHASVCDFIHKNLLLAFCRTLVVFQCLRRLEVKLKRIFQEKKKQNYLRGKQAPHLSEGEIKIILREFIISLKVKLKLITHTREKKCKLFEIRRG